MTTASIGSCGLEALLAILLFRRMAMGVPAGNSTAEAFQIRQIRTATHFMTRLSILRRCWQSVSLFLLSLRRRAFAKVGLRRGFVLERSYFVGVDSQHEIPNVIVDVGKPVPDSGGNDDDVARLQIVGHSVSNGDAVAARAV